MKTMRFLPMLLGFLMPLMGCDGLTSEDDGPLSLQLNMAYETVYMDGTSPSTMASISAKSNAGGMKFSFRVLDETGADVSSKFEVPLTPTPSEEALSFQEEHWRIMVPRKFWELGTYRFEVTLKDKNGNTRTKTASFEVTNAARERSQAIYTAGVAGFSEVLRAGSPVQWSGRLFFEGSHLSFRTRVLRARDTSDVSKGFAVECPTGTSSSPFDLSQIRVNLASSTLGTEEYLFEIRAEDEDRNWLVRRDTLRIYTAYEY